MMRLNPDKIEERIQRLQEIKRIASDPELVAMLFDFIELEDPRADRPRRISSAEATRGGAGNDEIGDLVNRVARSVGA
jgi:hypothetical protein